MKIQYSNRNPISINFKRQSESAGRRLHLSMGIFGEILKNMGNHPYSLTADAGNGSDENYAYLEERGIEKVSINIMMF